MEETKKLRHQKEKNETVVKLGGGGGIGAVVLFAGALATTAVATAFIAGRKGWKSGRKNQNRQVTPPPTALGHDNPSTETKNMIETEDDPTMFVATKNIIPDEKLKLEISGEKEIAAYGDEETLCYSSPKKLESNGISAKTFYAPVLCENLLFKPESMKIDQHDNNTVNVEENIVEVDPADDNGEKTDICFDHGEEDGETITVDKTAAERDLNENHEEEEPIITAENHSEVEQNILQHDKKEGLQVEVEAKTEEEMPCEKNEEIVYDDINGALEEELCLSGQNVENGEDGENQDVKDENTLVELYGDDLEEKDREETEMPFETIGGEDEEKVDHGENIDDQEMEGKFEEEQVDDIEDKTHDLSDEHFACKLDENESLLQVENVAHQEMEGKIEEDEGRVDNSENKANDMADENSTLKLDENQNLLHGENYQVIEGKIEEKVDDIGNKTNDMADDQFSGELEENESLHHVDHYLDYQEMEGKIEEDEDKVDSIENKTNSMSKQHFAGKVDEDENLLHIEMEGKIEEDEEKVDDIENKTDDMASTHFSGKPDENENLLHEENLNYQEIEAKIEEDKSLKAGKYNLPEKREGEYNNEYSNSEIFSINKSETKLGALSTPTRKRLLIGAVSVVSWMSWSWFFGLDFVKLCLIVLFTMAFTKIQGY